MSQNSTTTSGGIGFSGLLTVAFVVLKLTHVITWRWVWVLSPIWISLLIVIAIVLSVFIFVMITSQEND